MLEEFIAFVYLYNQEFSVNINVVCLEKNWYHVCLAAVITYFVDDVVFENKDSTDEKKRG